MELRPLNNKGFVNFFLNMQYSISFKEYHISKLCIVYYLFCRDHKTVYVGDARGRVFSWSVTDKPGRGIADHWVRDEGGENCTACGVKFSFAERRHHCRNCGQLFCSR